MTAPRKRDKPARRGPPRALEPRAARDAIAAVLALHNLTDEVRARGVVAAWGDVVGERIAARTRPVGVVERTFVVEVATSAWLHELTLQRPQLLARLLAQAGEPRLFDELRLVLARAPVTSSRPTAPTRRR